MEGMVCRKVDPTPRMELRPMTWDQVREFARAGWEIASHSKWHTCLGTDEPTIIREVYESYDDLARMGFHPTTFCAPGGFTGYTWATYEVKWAQTRYRFISGLGIGAETYYVVFVTYDNFCNVEAFIRGLFYSNRFRPGCGVGGERSPKGRG